MTKELPLKRVLWASLSVALLGLAAETLSSLNIELAQQISNIEWEVISASGIALYASLIAFNSATYRQKKSDEREVLLFVSRDWPNLIRFRKAIFDATKDLKNDFDAAPYYYLLEKHHDIVWEISSKNSIYDQVLSEKLKEIAISLLIFRKIIDESPREKTNNFEFKNSEYLFKCRKAIQNIVKNIKDIDDEINNRFISNSESH